MAAKTWRVSYGRISETTKYGASKPFEAYWSGKNAPTSWDEDLVAFPDFESACAWLIRKGASKHEVNGIQRDYKGG